MTTAMGNPVKRPVVHRSTGKIQPRVTRNNLEKNLTARMLLGPKGNFQDSPAAPPPPAPTKRKGENFLRSERSHAPEAAALFQGG